MEGGFEISGVYNKYDASQHRYFFESGQTEDEILANFLNSFDGVRGSNGEVAIFQVDVCIIYKEVFRHKVGSLNIKM